MKSWQLISVIGQLVFSPTGEAISQPEKFLLLAIAGYYRDPPGYAKAAETALALNILRSVRQTQRLIRSLEEKRLVRVDRLRGNINHYFFDYAQLAAAVMRGAAVHKPVDKLRDQTENVAGSKMSEATQFCQGSGDIALSWDRRQRCVVIKNIKNLSSAADSLVRHQSELHQAVNKSRQEVLRSRDLVDRMKPVGRRWPAEDLWLKQFLESADCFFIPIGTLDDPEWWDAVSAACGGVELEFLRPAFAKLRAWLLEHADRTPTSIEGWKELVRQWLCRENEYQKPKPWWINRNRISCMSGAALMPMMIIAWFALQHIGDPWHTHSRFTAEEKVELLIEKDEPFLFRAKL
jgi:hypothetical protein